MSKYKVGDIVKLSTGEKGTITKAWGRYSATIGDDDYDEYNFDEKEIIGLWEGYKPKLKLIDILNKIANGELKEGTRVIWNEREYTFGGEYEIFRCSYNQRNTKNFYMSLWEDMYICDLNSECELIEPNDFGKADKMAEHNHFADDGKMVEPTDNTKIEELDAYELDLLKIFYKLNEVIRYINKGAEE